MLCCRKESCVQLGGVPEPSWKGCVWWGYPGVLVWVRCSEQGWCRMERVEGTVCCVVRDVQPWGCAGLRVVTHALFSFDLITAVRAELSPPKQQLQMSSGCRGVAVVVVPEITSDEEITPLLGASRLSCWHRCCRLGCSLQVGCSAPSPPSLPKCGGGVPAALQPRSASCRDYEVSVGHGNPEGLNGDPSFLPRSVGAKEQLLLLTRGTVPLLHGEENVLLSSRTRWTSAGREYRAQGLSVGVQDLQGRCFAVLAASLAELWHLICLAITLRGAEWSLCGAFPSLISSGKGTGSPAVCEQAGRGTYLLPAAVAMQRGCSRCPRQVGSWEHSAFLGG